MSVRRWREKGRMREETRMTERKKHCKLGDLAEHQISIFLSRELDSLCFITTF